MRLGFNLRAHPLAGWRDWREVVAEHGHVLRAAVTPWDLHKVYDPERLLRERILVQARGELFAVIELEDRRHVVVEEPVAHKFQACIIS